MIDIHSHIIHDLDDGASSWDVSVAMLREYVRQGVHKVICTPHFEPSDYVDNERLISYNNHRLRQLNKLNQYAMDHGLDIKFFPGAEIILSADCLDFLAINGKSMNLTLANSNYILVELPRFMAGGFKLLDQLLFRIQLNGFIPILAHPERSMRQEGMLETLIDWYEQGRLLLQLNASSLVVDRRIPKQKRERYTRRKGYAKMLLDAGIIHFISSDAHNMHDRPPQNKLAYDEILKKYDEDTAIKLLSENAENIIEGLDLI